MSHSNRSKGLVENTCFRCFYWHTNNICMTYIYLNSHKSKAVWPGLLHCQGGHVEPSVSSLRKKTSLWKKMSSIQLCSLNNGLQQSKKQKRNRSPKLLYIYIQSRPDSANWQLKMYIRLGICNNFKSRKSPFTLCFQPNPLHWQKTYINGE